MQKIIAITGASSGIGFETARALAIKGHRILLMARDEGRGEKACEAIARVGRRPELILVELSSQASIRKAAVDIGDRSDSLDVLINNAGTWYTEFGLTEDGIERGFAVNHLAGFLLSHLLMPSLLRSGSGRIINLSSDMHFFGRMEFDDLNLQRNYHGLRSYAQSKLANVLFTYELDRRLNALSLPLSVHAAHPGLVRTAIGVKHSNRFHALVWRLWTLGGRSLARGAETSVFLASAPADTIKSGLYWYNCRPKSSSPRSHNQDDARRLWQISEELCQIRNYFGEPIPQPAAPGKS
jgi:retinol dehydrogenase 12